MSQCSRHPRALKRGDRGRALINAQIAALSLADIHASLERAADVLSTMKGSQAHGAQCHRRVADMEMLDKTQQLDPNTNETLDNCYCSALPSGSGLCLPCYMRWLAGRRSS